MRHKNQFFSIFQQLIQLALLKYSLESVGFGLIVSLFFVGSQPAGQTETYIQENVENKSKFDSKI